MTRRSRHIIIRTATLLAAAGLLVTTATAATAADPDPTYGQPEVGTCTRTTLEQAAGMSDPSDPVDCATNHTMRVIAVGQLPDALTWDSDLAKIAAAVDDVCDPAFRQTLGETQQKRLLTAYGAFWFGPTKAQRDAGARWFSCKLGLFGGGRLVPLPTDAVPALRAGKVPDSVALCRTAENYLFTTCSRKHVLRAAGLFTIHHDGYPGHRIQYRAMKRKCPDITGKYEWAAFYLSRAEWKSGMHQMRCYSVRKN
jgi:hypothetical protein